jgi:hypothetical protein
MKEGFNIDKILLNHLDDTAAITYMRGEFGETKTSVADFFIKKSEGHTNILLNIFIDTVISQHPYLENAAYFLLYRTRPNEKNYERLKAMIEKKYLWHDNFRTSFIMELSKYKKNGDTSFIAKILMHWPYYSEETMKFNLIRDNPINEYFPAITRFYRSLIHADSMNRLQETFLRKDEFEMTFESFLHATAAYKTKETAGILLDILNKKIYKRDTEDFKNTKYNELKFKYNLFNALQEYNCPYYKELLPLVAKEAQIFKIKYTLEAVEADHSFVSRIEPSDYW